FDYCVVPSKSAHGFSPSFPEQQKFIFYFLPLKTRKDLNSKPMMTDLFRSSLMGITAEGILSASIFGAGSAYRTIETDRIVYSEAENSYECPLTGFQKVLLRNSRGKHIAGYNYNDFLPDME